MTFLFRPRKLCKTVRYLRGIFGILTVPILAFGLYKTLWDSPADINQGEAVRLLYFHAPSAWACVFLYGLMVIFSIFYLATRWPLCGLITRAIAPVGAGFTLMALATGILWAHLTWGVWWVWDARLTSTLVLFGFYGLYLGVAFVGERRQKPPVISSFIAIVGGFNLLIVHYATSLFRTVHQGPSLLRAGGASIEHPLLTPLLIMLLAYTLLAILLVLSSFHSILSNRLRHH